MTERASPKSEPKPIVTVIRGSMDERSLSAIRRAGYLVVQVKNHADIQAMDIRFRFPFDVGEIVAAAGEAIADNSYGDADKKFGRRVAAVLAKKPASEA